MNRALADSLMPYCKIFLELSRTDYSNEIYWIIVQYIVDQNQKFRFIKCFRVE